jgi:hypothetical protein
VLLGTAAERAGARFLKVHMYMCGEIGSRLRLGCFVLNLQEERCLEARVHLLVIQNEKEWVLSAGIAEFAYGRVCGG